VDHRVEPPAWLPQGAAPEAADPEADDSPAVEDAQAAEDSDAAPAEGPSEEFGNGNGHGRDSSYGYSRDDSYQYGEESPFAEGTSYRSPFTPHVPASTSYESDEPASAANEPPGSDQAGGDDPPQTDPAGQDQPASGLSGSGLASDGLPGSSSDDPPPLPAAGLSPDTGFSGDTGFPAAGAGFRSASAGYTDTTAAGYTDTTAAGYTDTTAAGYTDTAAAPYNDPAALPYPAPEPLAGTGTAGEPGSSFSGRDTTAAERRAAFGTATTATGIGAALRAGKQRSTARFARVGQESKPRTGSSRARRANLVISRVEPWSVMKFSFLISLVLWIVLFVAVALLYYALSSLGVFGALQRTLASVTSSQTSAGVDLTKWTSATRVLGYTMLLGAVDVVLITAISTVGAVVYNLVTHLGGGIEVTLKETE
jgi:hypothetical protein